MGHGGDALGVETEPVEESVGHAPGSSTIEVLGVGGDDLVRCGLECVGERTKGPVLLGTAQLSEHEGGLTCGGGERADLRTIRGVDVTHAVGG